MIMFYQTAHYTLFLGQMSSIMAQPREKCAY
jgi:hypothetical protein